MKRIWAPWRLRYVAGEYKKREECLFCQKAADPPGKDRENYILLRGEKGIVILNLFPYNNGHLMVAPYQHVASLEELDTATLGSLMELVNLGITTLRRAMQPDGFNIGINLGAAAGAGIIDHIHIHVVPRWIGDTNFMPVLAETKVIPDLLDSTYDKLKAALLDSQG